MMMKFHSCRTAVSDEVPWKAQSRLVREKLLQDSLKMFLDLGLTAQEMSKLSGFSQGVIEEGLSRFDEMGKWRTASRSDCRWKTKHMESKRFGEAHMSNVLLAEVNIMVATDLAYELEARGATIAGITSSLEGALKLIDENAPDLAIMNVELQDGLSYPAARRLRALGIPYAFFTSFDKGEIEEEFWDVPHLMKPQACKAVAEFAADLIKTRPHWPAASPKGGEETMSAKG